MIDNARNVDVVADTRLVDDPIRARLRGIPGAVVVLALLGAGFVLGPLAMGMFDKAPQGATMLHDFTPFMSAQRLDGFSADLDGIDASVKELDASSAQRLSPSYADFSKQWPAINEDMSGLMDQVSDNLGNYQAVAALPSFRIFPWLFAAPGAVLLVAAGTVLVRRRWTRGAQVAIVAVGVLLVAIPIATGMFVRAPKGGQMMGTFKTLETTENVTRIQGYFSTMAVGQGAIRLEVVPALERQGLSADQVAAKYPATTELNESWIHILNDMTPMIGAMSDNVGHYQAISSMPPFAIFPWAFVVPGVLIVGLALSVGRPRRFTPAEGTA